MKHILMQFILFVFNLGIAIVLKSPISLFLSGMCFGNVVVMSMVHFSEKSTHE